MKHLTSKALKYFIEGRDNYTIYANFWYCKNSAVICHESLLHNRPRE
jgi:hypothetical protein